MNLKNEREAAGLTKTKVALLLNVTARTIFNWERGDTKPSVSELEMLNNIYQGERKRENT